MSATHTGRVVAYKQWVDGWAVGSHTENTVEEGVLEVHLGDVESLAVQHVVDPENHVNVDARLVENLGVEMLEGMLVPDLLHL